MTDLRVVGNDPYEASICELLTAGFPTLELPNRTNVLENVSAAILASGQLRYGPLPKPEALVTLRQVMRRYITNWNPIPILIPFGSRKAILGQQVDVAELMALKQVAALQARVKAYYAPGLEVIIQLEDVTGNYLFRDDGEQSITESRAYCRAMKDLGLVLGLSGPGKFLTIQQESSQFSYGQLMEQTDIIFPVLQEYIQETSQLGPGDHLELASWKKLTELGWRGEIPPTQRQYYYDRYAALDPALTPEKAVEKLSQYFSCAWARRKLNQAGVRTYWDSSFLKLSFCPPVPGVPAALVDQNVYYRTLPLKHAQSHMPAWRAKGYLVFDNAGAMPKLGSWRDKRDFVPTLVVFREGNVEVSVKTDYLVT